MGNITSEYLDLEYTNKNKEKSIYSFDVKLVQLSVEKTNKKLEKDIPNYQLKLKIYPTSIVLKRDSIIFFDFKYSDISSWYSSKQFFKFKTTNDECFSLLTIDKLPSSIIDNAFRTMLKIGRAHV